MTYTEHLTESLYDYQEGHTPEWIEGAKKLLTTVIEACWSKIEMPPREITAVWDEDDKIRWKSFRADVEDLLQSSYILLGAEMLGKFVQNALQSLQDRSWIPLEATLFYINALSDTITQEELVEQALTALFGSSLFVDISSKTEQIPRKAGHTTCEMISRYTTWIESHDQYLPAMLNFLFEFLKDDPSATMAAKAIERTCYSCRKDLVPQIWPFLQQYEALLSWDTIDSYAMQKVIGGIAAIISAIPTSTEEEKFEPLSLLIKSVERDVDTCVDLMKSVTPVVPESKEVEDAVLVGIRALKCLRSIGKGLQIPDDEPIDIDARQDLIESRFWKQGNGSTLQWRVLHILQTLLGWMKWHGDIIEAICDMLRTGYKEVKRKALFGVFFPICYPFSSFKTWFGSKIAGSYPITPPGLCLSIQILARQGNADSKCARWPFRLPARCYSQLRSILLNKDTTAGLCVGHSKGNADPKITGGTSSRSFNCISNTVAGAARHVLGTRMGPPIVLPKHVFGLNHCPLKALLTLKC
jgi:hypothetical protein